MWVFLVMIYLRYLWKEISYKGESIWNLALIGYFLDSNFSFHFVERIGSFGKADVHCPAKYLASLTVLVDFSAVSIDYFWLIG